MDTTIETIDAPIVGEFIENVPDISFGKEIAKTLALSAASTAGMIAGLVVVGLAVGKVQDARKKRADKKVAEKAAKVDVTDKTPANETN